MKQFLLLILQAIGAGWNIQTMVPLFWMGGLLTAVGSMLWACTPHMEGVTQLSTKVILTSQTL
jgi:hypothetical protein